jgi:multidrug resistance efflux pump
MQGRFPIRAVVIFCVLVLSTAAALWLGLEPGLSIAPGHVVAQEFRLSPVETGRLAAVLVTPGQRVLGGQLIARLDTSVIEREMAVVEARVRQLGAEASASSAALQSEGYQTERSFESDAAEAAGQVESARAEHAQQAAELKELGEELKRQKEYLREGLVKRDRVDELELRRNTLADTVSEWPARLKELNARHSSSVERLSQWRSRYSANSAPVLREIRVKPLKQRVAEEIEALRVLRVRLENAKLVAPADGEVVSVLARPGDVVRPGEPFVLLNSIGLREVWPTCTNARPRRCGPARWRGSGGARLRARCTRRACSGWRRASRPSRRVSGSARNWPPGGGKSSWRCRAAPPCTRAKPWK